MFKYTIKKFAAVGLVAVLCVPCCFASAQVDSARNNSSRVTEYEQILSEVAEMFGMTLEQALQLYGLTSVDEIARIQIVMYPRPNGQEIPVLKITKKVNLSAARYSAALLFSQFLHLTC